MQNDEENEKEIPGEKLRMRKRVINDEVQQKRIEKMLVNGKKLGRKSEIRRKEIGVNKNSMS